MKVIKGKYFSLLAGAGLAALLYDPSPTLAAVAPPLGTAASFAVLGTNSTPTIGTVSCTDTGPGIGIFGKVGTTFPGGITNTGCTITGPIVAPVAASVVADFNTAYAAVDSLNPVCTGPIPIVTTTLAPGVYCSAAGTTIGAGVILTLNGTASDIWVFRVGTGGGGALTLTNAQVVMRGTAQACNVYWKTAEAATVTDSSFVGTVLSGTAVTMTRGSWIGRGMATTDVTLTDPAPMTFAGCSAPPGPGPGPGSITINKIAVGGDDTFGYTGSAALGAPFNITTVGGTGSHVTTGLSAATYTVTETAGPAGWVLTGLACTDSTGGSTFTISGAQATIFFAAGGIVTCTYTNARAGSITINKTAVGGDATFGYTGSVELGAPFNITTAGGTGSHVTTGLAAGTYTVTESTVPAGWVLTGLACTDFTGGSTFTISGAQATIFFAEDGTVTCTYTNSLLSANSIPTLGEWAMIMLAALLVLFGVAGIRRHAM